MSSPEASERSDVTVPVQWHTLADGGRLGWLAAGPVDAPVVVALPGLSDGLVPLWADGMERVRAELVEQDLPVRAHLVSHRDPARAGSSPLSTHDLAADVVAFVEDHADGPVVLTGHSMGGMVAQVVAATRPDLVSHLVLTATAAAPDDRTREVVARWARLVDDEDWDGFVADANDCAYTGSELLRRRLVARVQQPHFDADLAARHRALTRACLHHDGRDLVGRIATPTLVVAGELDPVFDPASSRALADAIPGARFELLPGLAHGFPEQAPVRMGQLVGDLVGVDVEVLA